MQKSHVYSPGVLSLLPLYYVGWADSILSPSEAQLIQDQIDRLELLDDTDRRLLKK